MTGEAGDDHTPGRAQPDPRLEAAERLLREAGIEGARISAAGHRREIAVVETSPSRIAELARLAPRLKALGFLYVALDLAERGEAGAEQA